LSDFIDLPCADSLDLYYGLRVYWHNKFIHSFIHKITVMLYSPCFMTTVHENTQMFFITSMFTVCFVFSR